MVNSNEAPDIEKNASIALWAGRTIGRQILVLGPKESKLLLGLLVLSFR